MPYLLWMWSHFWASSITYQCSILTMQKFLLPNVDINYDILAVIRSKEIRLLQRCILFYMDYVTIPGGFSHIHDICPLQHEQHSGSRKNLRCSVSPQHPTRSLNITSYIHYDGSSGIIFTIKLGLIAWDIILIKSSKWFLKRPFKTDIFCLFNSHEAIKKRGPLFRVLQIWLFNIYKYLNFL